MTGALNDVAQERFRQIYIMGLTFEHDDAYVNDELCRAAAAYALAGDHPSGPVPASWPWHGSYWIPTDHRANLVKAGALILAEIERIDRAVEKERAS